MSSLISGADLWNSVDTETPTTWTGTGLDEVAQGIALAFPDDVARIRGQQFSDYAKYRSQPEAYIREILKIEPSPKQIEIAKALLTPPYKVLVPSCNSYGKTHLAGGLVNWYFDSYDPGLCITTAPRLQDVVEVLWSEVRKQRRTHDSFRGDMRPMLYANPGHYAEGYTGNNVTSFHGRHDAHMFFILDEATAIKSYVWTGIKSMFKPSGKHHILGLYNPTDTTSPAYAEEMNGNYTVIRLSALEHPNVLAELRGERAPIEQAVDTAQLVEWLEDPMKFEEVRIDDFQTGDVIWPPTWADQYGALQRFGRPDGYGGYQRVNYRPGPEGQARVLGLWPTSTPGAIWSDLAWRAACRELDGWKPLQVHWRKHPEIGCDVASGTAERGDKAAIVVQVEGVAVYHRNSRGWDIMRIAVECMDAAITWAKMYNEHRDKRLTQFLKPEQIQIKIDDGGLGCGVTSILKAKGFNAIPINASTTARNPDKYPRMRDEVWFGVPLAAVEGRIDLSRLKKKVINDLRKQAMGVQWKPDFDGKRQVEKKADTKKRIGHSPDDIDALNLAYLHCPNASGGAPEMFSHYRGSMPSQGPPPQPGLFG